MTAHVRVSEFNGMIDELKKIYILQIHTGDKPYECKFCEKTFNQSGARNAHMKIHTGERNYVCRVCNRAFTQSSSLNRHLWIHIRSECSSQEEQSNDSHHVELGESSYDIIAAFVKSL